MFRQTSIDVNDSIVRFLRDLFSLFAHEHVHRLILIYFSRFVMKEGKHWQDRDSKIGLRCSWEVCKLRLNAVTLLVRFPDFVDVNRPLMRYWEGWSLSKQTAANRRFFSESLERILSLEIPGFATSDGPVKRKAIKIPDRKPHWLVELVTDICLAASEHADQSIQLRGSSLLHELFWSQSQEGKANGNLSMIASMHVPFIMKVRQYNYQLTKKSFASIPLIYCLKSLVFPQVLGQLNYLSSLPAKSQLRKDIIPCAIFIMQSAPVGLLRALWRKLCKRAEGKGKDPKKYGGFGSSFSSSLSELPDAYVNTASGYFDEGDASEHSILDIFCLLNMALLTTEYEGSESNTEGNGDENHYQYAMWKQEYLEREEHRNSPDSNGTYPQQKKGTSEEKSKPRINTSSSRRWNAHDSAIVIINTSRYIVNEVLHMLSTDNMPHSLSTQLKGLRIEHLSDSVLSPSKEPMIGAESPVLNFSVSDIVIFVRATTSLYLHCLSLRQSDVVVCKTLTAAVEILKIFGIKVFLAAVGETLQHWMRTVLMQCGARRANVRVQALEFLALILRLTWDSYGSFYRVRVPLLAIQMEVMERIVSTAANRYYREQRLLNKPVEYLSNDAAEAALSPLWRTLDRLHHQSASQNVAFRSALMRLAETMKKLHTAYIAAHALAIANRLSSSNNMNSADADAVVENDDVSHRSMNSHTSSGLGRQFLGLHVATSVESVAHNEAVEDAFLAAADVFKSTELPSHRVAWLRKLSEFHNSRSKFAEEAICRSHIYQTLRQAAAHYDTLWNPVPFLPWTTNEAEGIHIKGEGPANSDVAVGDIFGDELLEGLDSGNHLDKVESFRKMFYRAASSVRMRTGDWDVSGNKHVFYGVCAPAEYNTYSPWLTLREIEEDMVEEVEIAGDLFLKANIEDSSRKAWTLATEIYSQNFNYARLSHAYMRLAQVVASHVPVVDTSNQLELSSHLGRFYRVYFHGSAPDEFVGVEFVYRTHVSVRLEQFGADLCAVLKSLLPLGTPIGLHLDDGRPEAHDGPGLRGNASLIGVKRPSQRRPVAHVKAGLEPIRDAGLCTIKITPLRPMLRNEFLCRGSLEWFYKRTEMQGFTQHLGSNASVTSDSLTHPSVPSSERSKIVHPPRHRSGISNAGSLSMMSCSKVSTDILSGTRINEHSQQTNQIGASVDLFSFTQPKHRDKRRGAKDWLKAPGDFAEKNLKVTKLQVAQGFPTCVTRQTVISRDVDFQSPLEAGVEAICSWCSVLFRSVVATNGRAVLGTALDHGIGKAAAKVVADCIHCARVKEMAQALLTRTSVVEEESNESRNEASSTSFRRSNKERLSESEIGKNQIRLARGIVMYLELLHLLIARNRDMLLAIVRARKHQGNRANSSSDDNASQAQKKSDAGSVSSRTNIDRTHDSIAVQSELQRAFIAMAKALYPIIYQVIDEETPSWLKLCCQDTYFSTYTYRSTRIEMGEELEGFASANSNPHPQNMTTNLNIAPSIGARSVLSMGTSRSFAGGPPSVHRDASSVVSDVPSYVT